MAGNDIDNDGCAYEGSDGVERNGFVGRKGTDEVAEKGDATACQHGEWENGAVVVCAEEQTCDVGNDKSDESDWTAESGSDGCEDACDKQ